MPFDPTMQLCEDECEYKCTRKMAEIDSCMDAAQKRRKIEMREENDIDMMSEEQEKEKEREREDSRRIAAGAEQRWASTMHKAFPSGTIEAAPSKKPEEGEDDNGAKEASGYKPR